MTDIGVAIATYGDQDWFFLARDRAAKSAAEQARIAQVHLPDGTLAQARNQAADMLIGRGMNWLVFLDADDEIEPGYIDAMFRASTAPAPPNGVAPLLTPRVRYVSRPGRATTPMFHAERPYQDGNWLVIGTAISSRLFTHVGGFEEWPMYEDWALFARAQKAGAEVHRVPGAVYRAWRRPTTRGPSRNHAGGRNAKEAAHDMIRRAVFPELYETP